MAAAPYFCPADKPNALPLIVHRGPCTVAAIQDAAGRFCGAHRTWMIPVSPPARCHTRQAGRRKHGLSAAARPAPAPEAARTMTAASSNVDIGLETPLPLAVAAERFGLTAGALRAETRRGRLVIWRVAGKDRTTAAEIQEMFRRCRVPPEAPAFGSEPTPPRARRVGRAIRLDHPRPIQ